MMEREELLERLLELKGKVPLSASDWQLINQALADPTLKKDLEMLELLDTLEDEARLQSSDHAAFEKFQKREFVDLAYFEPFYLKDFVGK